MNRLGFFLVAAVSLAAAAQAADLPTTKGPPTLAPGCFASFWAWLDSTAADCPLRYGGFTVYATLDAGLSGITAKGPHGIPPSLTAHKGWSASRAMARNGCGRRTTSTSRSSASR
jgi:hypothetical protein